MTTTTNATTSSNRAKIFAGDDDDDDGGGDGLEFPPPKVKYDVRKDATATPLLSQCLEEIKRLPSKLKPQAQIFTKAIQMVYGESKRGTQGDARLYLHIVESRMRGLDPDKTCDEVWSRDICATSSHLLRKPMVNGEEKWPLGASWTRLDIYTSLFNSTPAGVLHWLTSSGALQVQRSPTRLLHHVRTRSLTTRHRRMGNTASMRRRLRPSTAPLHRSHSMPTTCRRTATCRCSTATRRCSMATHRRCSKASTQCQASRCRRITTYRRLAMRHMCLTPVTRRLFSLSRQIGRRPHIRRMVLRLRQSQGRHPTSLAALRSLTWRQRKTSCQMRKPSSLTVVAMKWDRHQCRTLLRGRRSEPFPRLHPTQARTSSGIFETRRPRSIFGVRPTRHAGCARRYAIPLAEQILLSHPLGLATPEFPFVHRRLLTSRLLRPTNLVVDKSIAAWCYLLACTVCLKIYLFLVSIYFTLHKDIFIQSVE